MNQRSEEEKRTVGRLSEFDGGFDDDEERVVGPFDRRREQSVQLAFLDAFQHRFDALDLVRSQFELNRIERRFVEVRRIRILGRLIECFLSCPFFVCFASFTLIGFTFCFTFCFVLFRCRIRIRVRVRVRFISSHRMIRSHSAIHFRDFALVLLVHVIQHLLEIDP